MNKIIITLVVCVCIALCGCVGNGNLGRVKHNETIENVAPNILDLGDKEKGCCYYYVVDKIFLIWETRKKVVVITT